MFRDKGESPCRKVRGLLSEYIDSSLSSDDKSFVEHHLQTCEACSTELESLRGTVQLLHRVPEVPVPRSFTVTVPKLKRESAFGPASLRWLRPVTAIVAVALVVLLAGDFLHAFVNNAGVNSGGNATYIQLAPTYTANEQQTMVAVPGVMGKMSLATAKAVGYTDYTILPLATTAPNEQQVLVTVPGVMGKMSLATAKAVGYTNYSALLSSPVFQSASEPVSGLVGSEGPTGPEVMVQGESGVGWPLRQIEIGLGAAVFILLTLMIFTRRQHKVRVTAK